MTVLRCGVMTMDGAARGMTMGGRRWFIEGPMSSYQGVTVMLVTG